MKPIIPPYKHQKVGAKILDQEFNGRGLCADEMGLGKSMSSMLMACRRPKSRPILIVCPANLKYNWIGELKNHFGILPTVLEGAIPDFSMLPCEVYIISASVLGKWKGFIEKLGVKYVVVDEAHYFKNQQAKRTKHLREIVDGVQDLVFLGGTPLTKSPADLWPILNMIDPDYWDSFHDFVMEFTRAKRRWYGWDYSGAKNLKRLHRILKERCMVRRLKSILDPPLPSKSIHVVPLPIERRKEYESAEKDLISWVALNFGKAKAIRASKVEELVRFGYLKRLVAQLKMTSVFEWVDNFLANTDQKLILFAIHKTIIFDLKVRYKDICVVIDGSKTGKQKKQAEDDFNNDPETRLLIGNIDAAGVGLNLQKSCSTTAAVEMAWVPALHGQAMDRVDRIGQTQPTTHYFLVAHNTIEERLCEIIQERSDMTNQVLDGKDTVNKMDIFDMLSKHLKGK